MACSFEKTTPILEMNPTPFPFRAETRRWFLWPALAWRVQIANPRPHPLNLFQRTVLAMCATGLTRAGDIAQRLDMGRDLVAFIILQLQEQGFLDGSGAPTPRGAQILEEDQDEEGELVAGFVYSDPFTGSLWSRFVRGAPTYTDGEVQGHKAVLQTGPVGKRFSRDATVVWPPSDLQTRPPSPAEIRQAVIHFIRQTRQYRSLLDEKARNDTDENALSLSIRRVYRLSDEPDPVFLATFLFIPVESGRISGWMVSDPFGLGPSRTLQKDILREMEGSAGSPLRRLVGEAAGEASQVDPSDLEAMVIATRNEASRRVLSRLGGSPGDNPELLARLVQMEMARTIIEESKKVGNRRRAGREQQEALLRRAHEALEESLASLAATFCRKDDAASLDPRGLANAERLCELAVRLGFKDDPDDPCLERLLTVPRSDVYGVIVHGNRGLSPQVATALMACTRDGGHPLHRVAEKMPGFMVFLYQLKMGRGRSAHGAGKGDLNSAQADLSGSQDDLVDQVLDFVKLCHPVGATAGPVLVGRGQTWDAGVVHKLRALATGDVETRFSARIRDYPEVRDRLCEMAYLARFNEALAHSGLDLGDGLRDLPVVGAAACEAALSEFLFVHQSPVFPRSKEGLPKILAQIACKLGFTLEDGHLPRVLETVDRERVEYAVKTRSGSLNALMAAALLVPSDGDLPAPLADVARASPDFLLRLAHLSDLRGHGDQQRLTPREIPAFIGLVYGLVSDLLHLKPATVSQGRT